MGPSPNKIPLGGMKKNKLILVVCLLLGFMGRSEATTYATWLMIWNGSDQSHWWKATDYLGATDFLGKYKSIDWRNKEFINDVLEAVKRAGISVLILDLTNGWGWLNERVQYIQKLCAEKALKVCIAENSQGDMATFEKHCEDIWKLFAGPEAPYSHTYFRKNGKPVIVCYAIREWYKAYLKSEGPYRKKFQLVWASGEDSDFDKWGWQLEPWIGPMPSSDVVFVTPSIKWGNDQELWRTSIAWLDYTFKMGKSKNPSLIVVGSFDDIGERNGWLPCDTRNCQPSMQMRDIWGKVDFNFYYRRVSEWIGGKVTTIKGGVIPDGCYIFVSPDGRVLKIADERGEKDAFLKLSADAESLNAQFMVYHLGNNIYRIISPNFGLALEASPEGKIFLRWNEEGNAQRWRIRRENHFYYFINIMSGEKLKIEGNSKWILKSLFHLNDR